MSEDRDYRSDPDLMPGRPWPAGGGEMGALIRAHDWAATPLGPVEGWSSRLKVMVEQVLASPLVAALVCGPDLVLLYNDMAARLYGDRHPAALGQPLPQAFPEGWATVAPLYARALAGESVQVASQPLDTRGEGIPAADVFDAVLVPVRGEDGQVAGVHMTGFEVGGRARAETALHASEARLALLLDLGDAMRTIDDPAEIQEIAMRMLGQHLGLARAYCFRVERDAGGWVHVVDSAYQREAGQPSMVGRHSLKAFGNRLFDALERGEAVTIPDVAAVTALTAEELATYRAFGVRAFVNLPLLRQGEYSTGVAVHDTAPRFWTPEESALLREVGERAWAAVERARAEAALRHSEERLATVFEALPVSVGVVDQAGVLVRQNQEMQRFLPTGLIPSRDPARAGRWRAWKADGTRVAAQDYPSARALRGEGAPHGQEFLYVAEDGGEIWTRVAAVPLRGGKGETTGAVIVVADIDAIKRAQEAASYSEERSRALVTAGTISIYRMSPDWRLMYQLDSTNFLATTVEPIAGWADRYILLEDRPMVVEAVEQAIRSRSTFELECRVRLADRSVGWVRSRAVPILGRDGEIVEWFGAATDISARKNAEAALHESEERFRQFAEASADVLWIADARVEPPRLEYLSPAFEVVWGEPRDAVMGDLARWVDLLHPDDRGRALGGMPRLLAGEAFQQEYRIVRRRDGAARWILDTGFPIRDAEGRVVRVGGIAQDVTARKEADRELRASRRQWRALVEGIPQLVWRGVDAGEWTWSSPQWSAYTGLSAEASLGRGWLAAVHPDDRTEAVEAWRRAEASGSPLEADFRVWHAAEGRHRWFQTQAEPVRDEALGAAPEWLGTSTDVDDLVQFQDRQHLLLRELDHRVKNTLALVLAIAGQTGERAADVDGFLEAFEGRLRALAAAHDLLTRGAWGGVPLPELARAALAAHDGSRIAVGLDPGARRLLLSSTAAQDLALALHELATNAAKYGALSSPGGRVALDAAVADGELALAWREMGGPPVAGPPVEAGFGTTLLEQVAGYGRGGRVSLDWRPEGLACEMRLPLAAVEAPVASRDRGA